LPNENSELNFIYKATPVTPSLMRIWMHIPEFENDMRFLLSTKKRISNEDILDSMERIFDHYQSMLLNGDSMPSYVYMSGMRRGRNQMRRALGRDSIQD